jgi:hypothetical protein
MAPLMTVAEVAKVWRISPSTVRARLKPGSAKRNRVEPIYTHPDLRWSREAVEADLQRVSHSPVSVIAPIRGRERRVA